MVAELVTDGQREVFAHGRLIYTRLPKGKCSLSVEPEGGGTGLELTMRQSEALQLLAALREQYACDDAKGVDECEPTERSWTDDPFDMGGFDDAANG